MGYGLSANIRLGKPVLKSRFCTNYQPALELPNAVEQNQIVTGRITVDAREKDQLFLMMMAFLPFGKPVFTIYECFATKDHRQKQKDANARAALNRA
ncbi:MAG: hypothetical protein KF685_02005 [Acidobacteria bacterium]|nr:hypothetical protein [Acidobacteriota bacterium]